MTADLRRALDAIMATERLDLNPPVSYGSTGESPEDVVLRAGAEVVAELDELARTATPTGRVRAMLLLGRIAPARARPHLERMLRDPSPIVVNTCLVGFRRTADWARGQLGVAAPVPSAGRRMVRRLVWLAPYALFLAFILLAAVPWGAMR